MRRHLVLVGLPGSGKTTAGRLAAELLGAPFVDLDAEIERGPGGMTIAEIFARQGEPAFRRLEAAVMEEALRAPAGVIAPGGGWAAFPGRLEALGGRAYSIYLQTDPGAAMRRIAAVGGRPLLVGGQPEAALRALLELREPFYVRADATVGTDRLTPADVAARIAELARRDAGW